MEYGCAATLAELKRLWPSVVTMSVEQQAAYADKICRDNATDANWSEAMLQNVRAGFPHSPPNNTTGVGNIAFMSINAPEKHRQEWQTIHLAYTMFLKRQFKI